jgi:hypothetical protein
MTVAAVPKQDPWSTTDYLSELNKTALYAVTRGMVPLLVTHVIFLVKFTGAWVENQECDSAGGATQALIGGWPKWSQRVLEKWLTTRALPNWLALAVVLIPYVLPLAVLVPAQTGWSVLKSSWDVLRKGARGVPPLITAVVVVFVTSDAWRILGTGFTIRFKVLVTAFLLSSLLFLVRWNCWDDIDVSQPEAEKLLVGIRRKNMARFRRFIDDGATPAPLVRPRIPGTIWIYGCYWLLCAFALAVTALFVSAMLIIVGVILISKDETRTLATSVTVYQTLPYGGVITRQLLSLSFSLGAFAAFFLVAAQKTSDRRAFMRAMLRRYRRDLVAYSIYCRAHDRAADWTHVSAGARPLDHPPRPKGWFGGVIRRPLATAAARAKALLSRRPPPP